MIRRTLVSRKNAGFTLIEVMVAALVLGIGLVGILGMQSTAAIANRRAYDMRAAMELGETTLERLKRDAIEWTGQPNLLPTASWLGHGLTDANIATWTLPPLVSGASVSPMYNDMGLPNVINSRVPTGRELYVQKNSRYCVQYRLSWVIQNDLARADVRVLWASNRAGERELAGNCDAIGSGTVSEADLDLYYEWVRVSGMVRWNQLGAVPTTPLTGG